MEGVALSWRLCGGPAIVGGAVRGAVFSENSANFWENVQKSGLETGTVVKSGAFMPLGHNILEYLLNVP